LRRAILPTRGWTELEIDPKLLDAYVGRYQSTPDKDSKSRFFSERTKRPYGWPHTETPDLHA
jgi:hypothetical protein